MVHDVRILILYGVERHQVPVCDVRKLRLHLHVDIFSQQRDRVGKHFEVCGVSEDLSLQSVYLLFLLRQYDVVVAPISGSELLHGLDVALKVCSHHVNLGFAVARELEHVFLELVFHFYEVFVGLFHQAIDAVSQFLVHRSHMGEGYVVD